MLAGLLDSQQPELVVYAAGWTWVDGCESDPARAERENHTWPAQAAAVASARGARFVFLSTSYVFDGCDGPYDEDAQANPLGVYGRTKLAGELAVLDATGGDALIARTMGVYGPEPQRKNFVYQVRARLGAGERMWVPDDQFGNATYAEDLAGGILQLAQAGYSGIWNVAGPEPDLCRAELARRIARAYSLDECLLECVPTTRLQQQAPRPRHGGLHIARIRQAIGFDPASWITIP